MIKNIKKKNKVCPNCKHIGKYSLAADVYYIKFFDKVYSMYKCKFCKEYFMAKQYKLKTV